MDSQSVFHQEWLRSLREQFKRVARNDDRVTLSSLTAVMQNVGFRDEELAQLRLEATMRVDDVGEAFRADMSILDKTKAATAHPAECLCPECAPIDESLFDAEGQPVDPDPDAEDEETRPVFAVAELDEIDARQDPEPRSFEDSIAAEALLTDEAESQSSGDEDEGEGDADAPAQMNLF